MTGPTITAFDWVPAFARGQVRDLRVRWTLEEVEQRYDERYLSQGQQKSSPYRDLQPYGQVPTFEEDGLRLFESGAIVFHLAMTRPGLLSEGATARARAFEWGFAALNTVEPPIMDHAFASLFERGEPWSAPRLPDVEARIRQRFADPATRLGEREWYDGAFSAGDLLMIAVLRIMRDSDLLAEQPVLADYVARGEARPAFRRALEAQMAGFTGAPSPEIAAWLQQEGLDG